jgi:predicted transposase YbfD/YdcC
MQAVVEVAKGEVVAIDGKTIRRSFDCAEGLGPIHMVSAWAKRNGVSLGQVKTEEKSNEIPAIPALLGLLELRGCIVTIDAMGCQREIAEKIRAQGADYVLAVKKNQQELHQAIENYFETAHQAGYRAVPLEQLEEVDSGHGRARYDAISWCPTCVPCPSRSSGRTFKGSPGWRANVTSVTASPPKCVTISPPSGRMLDAWPRRCGAIGALRTHCIGCWT